MSAADGYRPEVGDLILLPRYLPAHPYRVLSVEELPEPGRIHIGGYLILDDLSQLHAGYDVPVSHLARARDEVWDR